MILGTLTPSVQKKRIVRTYVIVAFLSSLYLIGYIIACVRVRDADRLRIVSKTFIIMTTVLALAMTVAFLFGLVKMQKALKQAADISKQKHGMQVLNILLFLSIVAVQIALIIVYDGVSNAILIVSLLRIAIVLCLKVVFMALVL